MGLTIKIRKDIISWKTREKRHFRKIAIRVAEVADGGITGKFLLPESKGKFVRKQVSVEMRSLPEILPGVHELQ